CAFAAPSTVRRTSPAAASRSIEVWAFMVVNFLPQLQCFRQGRAAKPTQAAEPMRSVSLGRDFIDSSLENNHYSLAQREVTSQLRKLLQQREILLAPKTNHGLRQPRITFVFGVGPNIVDQIESLAACATYRIAARFFFQLLRLLLSARLLA